MNVLARIISVLLHPLFMATYLFALFMVVLPSALAPIPFDQFRVFLLLIFLVTFVLPALNVFLFRTIGYISSLSMPTRRERIVPFIFIAVLYCAMTYMFFYKNTIHWSDNFFRFLMIIDMIVLIGVTATFFFKISIHSLAICGVAGILLPLNRISEEMLFHHITILVIVLAGVVMSARLQLNAHSPREVMVGGLLGFAAGFGGMLILF